MKPSKWQNKSKQTVLIKMAEESAELIVECTKLANGNGNIKHLHEEIEHVETLIQIYKEEHL